MRKDDYDVDGGGGGAPGADAYAGNFKGQRRSNDTHESTKDGDARLYRQRQTVSELRYLGHTLGDSRHGLVTNAVVTLADGYAKSEAAKAIVNDARQARDDSTRVITVGVDKGYDAREFIEACQAINVITHVAQNKSGRNSSAVSDATAQSEGHQVSKQKRKLIEQGFGWVKTMGGVRKVIARGIKRVDQMFVLTMAGHNMVRMRTLEQLRQVRAQEAIEGNRRQKWPLKCNETLNWAR